MFRDCPAYVLYNCLFYVVYLSVSAIMMTIGSDCCCWGTTAWARMLGWWAHV